MSSRLLGRRKIATLKTCWRHLQDISWRRLQDVFKINKCLLGYNYLRYDNNENKKVKGTNKCAIKWNFKFEDYKHYLEEIHVGHKIIQLE